MFDQLSAEIVPSLTKGRHNNNNTNTNNNKAKCIPGGTLRVLAGKNKDTGGLVFLVSGMSLLYRTI
jgi:hypothetical protein